MTEPYIDKEKIMAAAGKLLGESPVSITSARCRLSPGTVHDYYSNGDYWWPNKETPDGLPYVQRDGATNPENFTAHRMILRKMRLAVTHFAAAYRISGDSIYAEAAEKWLEEFFLREDTYMAPHLAYAQAIPGVCDGRGIGIIDTLHLIDVPQAAEILRGQIKPSVYEGLKDWFSRYLHWMNTHPNGIEEREWHNNHSVTWFAQAASFARFTGDEEMLKFCRHRFKTVLLPNQMAPDGSFPYELERTKPFNYSCFVLDNMANICLLASSSDDDLWEFCLPDGRGMKKALEFLYPYLKDKQLWPYGPDIEHDEEWPVAMPFLAFAALHYEDERYLELWNTLKHETGNQEIMRNIAIRCPFLYFPHYQ